jgi:hypothetical protein
MRPPINHGEVAQALATVNVETLGSLERETLGAWLAALQDHYPRGFASVAGPIGATLRKRLAPADHARFIKLRRIALANLAQIF